MSFKDDDKPPTSKDEALASSRRPPLEKYNPDKLPRWSITMTAAWIIWRDLDAVRIEWDDYREKCADWKFEKTLVERLAEKIASNDRTGLARRYPDVQKKLQEKLKEQKLEKEPSSHRRHWPPSSWNGLCLKAISEAVLDPRQQVILSSQDARVELWQAAGEGRIKATAREYKNAKSILGDPIEIPAHYWPHLKRADDRLTGKPILSDDNGRVYREVQFSRLDVKELWPMSACSPNVEPSVSGEKGGMPLQPEIASEVATPKKPGRKKGNGSYAAVDLPLLDEMKELISSHRAASPQEAARMLAGKAHGSGTLESKIERLARRYRSGPNSLGSGS
jgi:hypothetical protein